MSIGHLMVKIKQAVFDAGPFIHLSEINHLATLVLFEKILTTPEIFEECKKIQTTLHKIKNILLRELDSKHKDLTKYFIERYEIHLGEATGLALCKQEQTKLFFTDDLSARETAYALGFESHGTIAIILRAFREKILNKNHAKEAINALHQKSSLFFTKDLHDWTLRELEKYSD